MEFLSTFTNVAFVHEAIMAMNGRPVSVRRGFSFALKRIKAILLWSLFAGVIGMLLIKLEEKLNIFGKLGLRLAGMAWSVASIFAIQVMIRDETSNPIELVQKSIMALKKKWGETVAGYIGLSMGVSLMLTVFLVGGFILGVVLIVTDVVHEPAPGTQDLIRNVGFALLLLALVFQGIINNIFRCALYLYATEDVIPSPFDPELMDAAWKVKKS
jgi:hypothetical protein